MAEMGGFMEGSSTIEQQVVSEYPERLKSPILGQRCLFCVKRDFCKEICPEVEDLLPKKNTGRHKKELIFENHILDIMAANNALYKRYGQRYITTHQDL